MLYTQRRRVRNSKKKNKKKQKEKKIIKWCAQDERNIMHTYTHTRKRKQLTKERHYTKIKDSLI